MYTRERLKTHGVFVGKREGKKRLAGPAGTWKDNIKLVNKEIRREAVEWFQLPQYRKP